MSVSAMDGPALSGLDPAVSQSESRSDFYALEAAQEEFVHLAEPVQVQTRASLPPLERPAPVSWGEARLDKLDAVEAENCAADSHPQPRPSEAQVAAPEGQIEGLHIAAPNLVLGGALAQSEHLELRHGQNQARALLRCVASWMLVSQVGQDGFSSILPEKDVPTPGRYSNFAIRWSLLVTKVCSCKLAGHFKSATQGVSTPRRGQELLVCIELGCFRTRLQLVFMIHFWSRKGHAFPLTMSKT